MADETIGLIGVGLLGSAIAERLIESGYRILGFDLDNERMRRLVELGGLAANAAEDVIVSCDRTLISLPDSHVVEKVVDSLSPHLREESILIDTTTGDPEITARIACSIAALGASYLDATVAGSSAKAREGDVVMMVGGAATSFGRCEDLFECLAHRTFHVGPSGSGSRMKLIVNLVLGLNRAVLAEGLHLAGSCGIDTAIALEILRSGVAYSAAMDVKGPRMVAGEFEPQARLAQHHKDVGLILELGRRSGTELPLSTTHEQLLKRAIERGYGAADNSAIIRGFG